MSLRSNPKIRQFSKLELLARQIVEGFITGLHKSPFHGFSVEFAEHKHYNKGESTRHIDWKLYAKTEKLFTKRYEEETNLRCQLVIDTSGSMHYPDDKNRDSKLQFSLKAAAALTHLLRTQRDAIGLSLFNSEVTEHLPAKLNEQHIQWIYKSLDSLMVPAESNQATAASEAIHQIAERINRRGLVVLFSDMMEGNDDEDAIFQSLLHLKHKKHEVVLFHILDRKTEAEFEFENKPYTFIDKESGEKIKMNPFEAKNAYQKLVKEKFHNLDLRCGQMGIDFVPIDIQDGFDRVLFQYLSKRAAAK